ncbi:hypothetical protein GCM10010198_00470 [Nocardia seriolae]
MDARLWLMDDPSYGPLATHGSAEYWPTYTPPTTSPLLIIAAFLTPIGAAFGTAVMATVTSRNKERELSRMYAEKETSS